MEQSTVQDVAFWIQQFDDFVLKEGQFARAADSRAMTGESVQGRQTKRPRRAA
jgi:hypothetical protein